MIGNDYLTVDFTKVDQPTRYIKNKRVRFGIASSGALSTLDITKLTPLQIEVLRYST